MFVYSRNTAIEETAKPGNSMTCEALLEFIMRTETCVFRF